MSTKPEPHQGLGVAQYLWASSPLRRYSDLVNQRQLLAVLDGSKAPYADGDAELFAVLGDFELTYAQYAEFQNQMEHYWCLRWLAQEGVTEATATVCATTSCGSTLCRSICAFRTSPRHLPHASAWRSGASTSSPRPSTLAIWVPPLTEIAGGGDILRDWKATRRIRRPIRP